MQGVSNMMNKGPVRGDFQADDQRIRLKNNQRNTWNTRTLMDQTLAELPSGYLLHSHGIDGP